MSTPVTETHWATSARERMADFIAALPSVTEGDFALWQRRVDRGSDTPHTSLFIVTAYEYERTEIEAGKGRSEPNGVEYTMLIVADTRNAAIAKAQAQLDAHGLKPSGGFLFRTNASLLCLA